ncbi:MAG: acetyl-CoA carboxylase carboxyl transferase subunit alpha, partial [Fimbriimonadaceae bacterium]
VADRVLMLEHAIYSVIPPEGCAAILWRMPEKGPQAAAALKLTAQSALEFGLIDGIVPEPKGGAHRDLAEAAQLVGQAIRNEIRALDEIPEATRLANRYAKYRAMGKFESGASVPTV